MKWLTYGNQITLGILVLGIGHLMSWVTDVSLFINLGWIFYGLLFVVHPVWSEHAAHHPHVKRYTQLAGVIVMLLGLMLRTGGGDDFWFRRIEENLGTDVSDAVIVQGYDDHGGFHGDGTLYAVLEFSDNELETAIAAPGGWHSLPLTENLQTLVYGNRSPEKSVGPFIGITMPKADRGYWYFYDRQGQTMEDSDVLNRNSFNYTIAIYDADKDLLYYCEYDT